jgi:hypothetical protein
MTLFINSASSFLCNYRAQICQTSLPQSNPDPVPEWQMAPVDEEPPDDPPPPAAASGDFSQNMALARLAAQSAEDNLISLTNDMNREVVAAAANAAAASVNNKKRRSEDMDLCHDDDAAGFGHFGPPPLHKNIPLPGGGGSGEFSRPPPQQSGTLHQI